MNSQQVQRLKRAVEVIATYQHRIDRLDRWLAHLGKTDRVSLSSAADCTIGFHFEGDGIFRKVLEGVALAIREEREQLRNLIKMFPAEYVEKGDDRPAAQ